MSRGLGHRQVPRDEARADSKGRPAATPMRLRLEPDEAAAAVTGTVVFIHTARSLSSHPTFFTKPHHGPEPAVTELEALASGPADASCTASIVSACQCPLSKSGYARLLLVHTRKELFTRPPSSFESELAAPKVRRKREPGTMVRRISPSVRLATSLRSRGARSRDHRIFCRLLSLSG